MRNSLIPRGSAAFRHVCQCALALALAPCTTHAQLAWSVFDETTTTPVSNNPDGTTSVTVPAGKRATLIATNFQPVDFSAAAPAEVYVTINFKASAGLSTIGSGTRAIGFGLYNTNNTGSYADDSGYFTWLNGRATGSLIELRRRNGDGTSPSLLNPTGTAFNSLGTGTKVFTSGALSDGNSYSIQLHLMARNPGVSLGNTSSTTTGAGVWVNADDLSQTAYTNPDNPPATLVFNEVGFLFYNSTPSDVTLTINSLTGLTPINPPAVTTQPPAISVNPGQSATLTVGARGTPPITYQWNKGGSAIAGATNAAYTIANAQSADAGSYTVTLTNAYGTATSNAATLTVTSQPIVPTITTQPAAVTVVAGGNATFTVAAYGSSPLTYQWNKDGTALPAATNTTLTLTNVAPTDVGNYTVTLNNSAGSVTSSVAALTVNTKPAFTAQPATVITAAGQTVTFTAAASGSPTPTIQWQRNGVNIAGATGNTLTLANVALANTGVYTARAANSVGAVVSSGAYLGIPSTISAAAMWPANGANGVNIDTPLRVTFNQTPAPGNFGKIQIHRASDGVVVDTLDLGVTPYTRTIGTQSVQYIFYPIIVDGKTAQVFPHAGVLKYGETYYVTIDPGAINDATGATFAGISDPMTWRFTTKASGPAADATAVTVAADGSGDFTTVQGAVDFVPLRNSQRVVINVKKGTYTEMVYVGKPMITVRGEDRAGTVIQYADNNNFNTLTGNNRAMFSVDAPDFTLETITLHNLTPKGGSQAEAFRANALRVTLNRVNLLSYQDTFLVNGNNCSAFVTDSYIEGDVDFMWGSGAVYFQHCELKALNPGYYAQVRNNMGQLGHVYVDCRLTSAPGVTGSYLARIDPTPGNFPYSQVIYIDCAMGPHIVPEGWLLNNATSSATVQFWEYHSTDLTGATLDVSRRIPSSHQLTEAQADLYRNPAYVLGGWVPQIPATIETSPASVSVLAGTNAQLTVAANGSPAPVFQWYKDGVAIAGATDATLDLPNAQAAAAGSYSVTAANVLGSATSSAAVVSVTNGTYAGEYFGTVGNNGKFALHVRNTGTAVLLGTTGASGGALLGQKLTIDDNGQVHGVAGAYVFDATIAGTGAISGTLTPATGSGATLTVTGSKSSMTGAAQAFSGYYQAGAAGGSAAAAFVVDAAGNTFVVTQAGGSLDSGSGITSGAGQSTVTTAGGQTITTTFSSGVASAALTPSSGSATTLTGINDVAAPGLRFREISARAQVGTGDDVAIVGFNVAGGAPDDVLIRGIGPTLGMFGVSGTLPNPTLELYKGASLLTSNTGWTSTSAIDLALATARGGAFPLPWASADSALHVSLSPGAYTAILKSASGTTSGVGLLELYDLSNASVGQRLTNISARATVGAGAATLIAGVAVEGSQPKRVLIRAVGPGLSAFGISKALAKPVLTVYSGTKVVAQNTGWTTSADAATVTSASAVVGTFVLGATSADSAMVINLSPGLYTVQVTSGDGSTGTAMVEIYELP